ncbi:50S ribosomal protein L34e [Candidatus Woesearchaeota archaeon]|nr:50S ribosomal protein L34e [Candidatus Woesearchaeota archaeon]
MPAGNKKSGTFRKVFRKASGGKTVVHYKKKKPKQHSCASCGKKLIGIPRLSPVKMQNTPKTKKRPERPYGGILCSACTRKKITSESRS